MLYEAREMIVTQATHTWLAYNLLCFNVIGAITLLIDSSFQKSGPGEQSRPPCYQCHLYNFPVRIYLYCEWLGSECSRANECDEGRTVLDERAVNDGAKPHAILFRFDRIVKRFEQEMVPHEHIGVGREVGV